jgi:hypothetical protein
MQNNRFDLYFSYWILLWLVFIILFYKKGILPFYSFILALLYHTTIVIYTFILNKKKIILHMIIVIIIKIIPIIIIYNYYYNRINFRKELVLFIILFGLYIIWKYIINNVDLLCEIKDLITNGIANDTPLKNIIHMCYNNNC